MSHDRIHPNRNPPRGCESTEQCREGCYCELRKSFPMVFWTISALSHSVPHQCIKTRILHNARTLLLPLFLSHLKKFYEKRTPSARKESQHDFSYQWYSFKFFGNWFVRCFPHSQSFFGFWHPKMYPTLITGYQMIE